MINKNTNILIISHPQKSVLEQAQLLAARLNIAGFSTNIISDFNDVVTFPLKEIALCISVGGDGTVLRAARLLNFGDCTLLPLAYGNLSFLACEKKEKDEIELVADCLAGEISLYNPALLRIELFNENNASIVHFALNDVSFTRDNNAQVLNFKYYINDTFLQQSKADGFVVASSFGSTGYALSSGGAIVNPYNNSFVFSQIAPHSLANRCIVSAPSDVLEAHFDDVSSINAQLSIDGRIVEHDRIKKVVIQRSPCELKFARPSYDYYEKIQETFFK